MFNPELRHSIALIKEIKRSGLLAVLASSNWFRDNINYHIAH